MNGSKEWIGLPKSCKRTSARVAERVPYPPTTHHAGKANLRGSASINRGIAREFRLAGLPRFAPVVLCAVEAMTLSSSPMAELVCQSMAWERL